MKGKNVTLGKNCFHNPLKTQDFKFATVEDGFEKSFIQQMSQARKLAFKFQAGHILLF